MSDAHKYLGSDRVDTGIDELMREIYFINARELLLATLYE